MGRATLILVILMSTIFAGISLRLQNDMTRVPDLLAHEQLKKETENVSDYALRFAVVYAKQQIFGAPNVWRQWQTYITHLPNPSAFVHTLYFDGGTSSGGVTDDKHFPVLTVTNPQNGSEVKIDRIEYHHIGGEPRDMQFLAKTYVKGRLQGSAWLNYPAEVAFNYRVMFHPNCFYYEYEEGGFNNTFVPDTSGQDPPNDGFTYKNKMHSAPVDVNSWKGAYFDGEDASDHIPTAFYAPDNTNGSLRVSDQFTLVLFVKCDNDMAESAYSGPGTLVWLPSSIPNGTLNQPSIGIWYSGADMNFAVGISNTHSPTVVDSLAVIRLADYKFRLGDVDNPGMNREPWDFLAFTFRPSADSLHSVLNVYTRRFFIIDGRVQEQTLPSLHLHSSLVTRLGAAVETINGLSIGGRIRNLNTVKLEDSEFDGFFKGNLEDCGMYDRALTADEIEDFFWNTVLPNRLSYLRD